MSNSNNPELPQMEEDSTNNPVERLQMRIEQGESLLVQGDPQILNSNINNLFVVEKVKGKFDERRLFKCLKDTKRYFVDPYGSRKDIETEMFENTPLLLKTNFQDLKKIQRNLPRLRGSVKIANILLDENGSIKREYFAFVGESGSGKSTLLEISTVFLLHRRQFVFKLNFREFHGFDMQFTLVQFLFTYGCPPLPFDYDEKDTLAWLYMNQEKCSFLLDGLDECPFNLKDTPPQPVAFGEKSSASNWVRLFVSRRIFERSLMVISSRPSSMFDLGVEQRPELIYTLNGFQEMSMLNVLKFYHDEQFQNIFDFIRSNGEQFMRFSSNPFVLSIIALLYMSGHNSITSSTTLVGLYINALNEYIRSKHVHVEDLDVETRELILDLVDLVYFQFHNDKKTSFTERDIQELGLSLKHLETHSMVLVSTTRRSHYIAPEEKWITPSHRSVQEFHVARYIVKRMNLETFQQFIHDFLFSSDHQDLYHRVRRFLCGYIALGQIDEGKKKIFIDAFGHKLKSLTSEELYYKYFPDMERIGKESLLQGYLYQDLEELGPAADDLMKYFSLRVWNLHVKLDGDDGSSLDGPLYMIEKLHPHLDTVRLDLPDDFPIRDLRRFASAFETLQENVKLLHIHNLQLYEEEEEDLMEISRLMTKVDGRLHLSYHQDVSLTQVDEIIPKLQILRNQLEESNMHIHFDHRYRKHLITGTFSPVFVSSRPLSHLLLPSPLAGKR